jgi:hypothetical protein
LCPQQLIYQDLLDQSSDVELSKRVADQIIMFADQPISHEIDLTSDRFVTTF